MFRVIFERDRGQRVPVRIWARQISPDTIRQLQRLAARPYVVDFVAAMADAHVAEGVAVGSVFATERTVVPRALGGDLGCGMSALRIGVDAGALDRRELEAIVQALGRAIPTGDEVHRERGIDVPDNLFAQSLSTSLRPDALRRAMRRVVYPEHLARHPVEEAPSAYRDIIEVLEDQEDLVRRRLRLEPVAVLKG